MCVLLTPRVQERLISGEALIGEILIGPLEEFYKGIDPFVMRSLGTVDGVKMFA